MAKLILNGATSGSVTLESPAVSGTTTLTLPTTSGTIALSGGAVSGTTGSFSGDLSFNSGYGSVATAYGCRAWVNFNGTGTPAIRASGNVSSITDNGTGDYRINFTTAMPDANYSSVGGVIRDSSRDRGIDFYSFATTSVSVEVFNISDQGFRDISVISVSVFR